MRADSDGRQTGEKRAHLRVDFAKANCDRGYVTARRDADAAASRKSPFSDLAE